MQLVTRADRALGQPLEARGQPPVDLRGRVVGEDRLAECGRVGGQASAHGGHQPDRMPGVALRQVDDVGAGQPRELDGFTGRDREPVEHRCQPPDDLVGVHVRPAHPHGADPDAEPQTRVVRVDPAVVLQGPQDAVQGALRDTDAAGEGTQRLRLPRGTEFLEDPHRTCDRGDRSELPRSGLWTVHDADLPSTRPFRILSARIGPCVDSGLRSARAAR
jgi:hypothetical protein